MAGLTPIGRVVFPYLFEKNDYDGKYAVVLVFKKNDDLSKLFGIAESSALAKYQNGKFPYGFKTPFRKCSEKEMYISAGFDPEDTFITFRTDKRPGVVDHKVQPIIDPDEIYPGCFGRVSYSCYVYDKGGGKGVAMGLINFQKCGDGTRLSLGGTTSPEQDFDEIGFDEIPSSSPF